MFDYKNFKKDLQKQGHKVQKKGAYIHISPNNNLNGYSMGFCSGWDVIPLQYRENLKFVKMDHFNSWINSVTFKISID